MITRDTILEQFVYGYASPDAHTAVCKADALEWINERLGTNYKAQHLNNWLAGRAGIPRRVAIECGDYIMRRECE